MSLIQEALRRQQEEFNKEKDIPTPPSPPLGPVSDPKREEPLARPVPASVPSTINPNAAAALAPARRPPPRGTLVLLGAFVVTALLFAISGYFLSRAFKASETAEKNAFSFPLAKPSDPAVPAPDTTNRPASVPPAAPARPATEPIMNPRARLAETVKATESYVKEADAIIERGVAPEDPPNADVAVASAPVVDAPAERSQPAPAAPRVVVEPAVQPSPAKVASHALPGGAAAQSPAPTVAVPQDNAWPKITLTGTMMKLHSRDSAAMINRTLVGAGEMVTGVSILDVRHNSVLVEYRGVKRILYVGQSTE